MRRDRSGRWTRLVRATLTALGLWFIAPLAVRGEMLLVNGSFVASDGAENDHLGQAVAVSGDMTTPEERSTGRERLARRLLPRYASLPLRRPQRSVMPA